MAGHGGTPRGLVAEAGHDAELLHPFPSIAQVDDMAPEGHAALEATVGLDARGPALPTLPLEEPESAGLETGLALPLFEMHSNVNSIVFFSSKDCFIKVLFWAGGTQGQEGAQAQI